MWFKRRSNVNHNREIAVAWLDWPVDERERQAWLAKHQPMWRP